MYCQHTSDISVLPCTTFAALTQPTDSRGEVSNAQDGGGRRFALRRACAPPGTLPCRPVLLAS